MHRSLNSFPTRRSSDLLIARRGDSVYAVLNLYPYNSGHLMVVPYRHVADYTELDDAETAEVASFTKQALTVLREVDRKSTRLNSSHMSNSYAVFCLKKK